jgi:hypothetical protein
MRKLAVVLIVVFVAASLAIAGAAIGSSQVFFKTLGHPPKVKPSRVYPGGAINAPYGSNLRNWKHWGARLTRSRGVLHYNTCRPDCAEGYHRDSGTVLLNGIRNCHGQRRYLKIHLRFDHHAKYNDDIRLNCRGDIRIR